MVPLGSRDRWVFWGLLSGCQFGCWAGVVVSGWSFVCACSGFGGLRRAVPFVERVLLLVAGLRGMRVYWRASDDKHGTGTEPPNHRHTGLLYCLCLCLLSSSFWKTALQYTSCSCSRLGEHIPVALKIN
jgi:hypothetical protein